jgi:hypothetical protein
VALHKAKHKAVAERIKDVTSAGKKVILFCCFQDGITKHKKSLGDAAVTITGSDNMVQRQEAVDRFQTDPTVMVALCNLIAGGVGITLTAGSHVIFQDLDWVPANHLQAEDRAYRMGQKERVTVEYFVADRTLDGYIGTLMDRKLALISAVESDELPDASLLNELYADLAKLAPALMQENRALATEGDAAKRIEQLAASMPKPEAKTPLTETGVWEFPSSRDPKKFYSVTFGRAGHLECTCEGFGWRGECSHIRKVRAESLAA